MAGLRGRVRVKVRVKRGMVGERKIGKETGVEEIERERERERQPQRWRSRDRGERKINRET